MPTFTIVARPNGSGKSTLTKWNREALQDAPILDPDAISRTSQADSGAIDASDFDAARVILLKAEELLDARQSFTVETTLSGKTYLKMAKRAKLLGYVVRLFFVGTSNVGINIERVRERVLRGGHDIPLADQLRRYPRSFENMKALFAIADYASLYDNSGIPGYVPIATKTPNSRAFVKPHPEWASFLLDRP